MRFLHWPKWMWKGTLQNLGKASKGWVFGHIEGVLLAGVSSGKVRVGLVAGVWSDSPVLVEMRGWAESPRSHLDLSPHGFWSLLGTAWALLSYPGAVGDCRWQRFGEIGFVWKQISLSLLQIIYFWRGKSNQAAKNSIAMTSWWCLAYSRRLPCV